MGSQQLLLIPMRMPMLTRHSLVRRGVQVSPLSSSKPGKLRISYGYSKPRACARPDDTQKEGEKHSHLWNLSMVKVIDGAKLVLNFANKNFLPLALLTGVIVGLVNPVPGCLAEKYSFSKWSASGIFLVSGLTLKSGEMGAAIEAWPAAVFGLASILLFTPIISRLILQLKLMPQELVTGLAIFCCMPTTLSSGVTLTQVAGGNAALALMLTLASNLLGILTVPFMLSKLVAHGVGVSVPARQLLKSLILTLLLPLLLGKGIRTTFDGVAKYVDQRQRLFSMLNGILLSLVPWMQVSGSRTLLLTVSPMNFIIAIAIGMGLHVIFLSWNAIMTRSLSLIFGDKTSVFGRKENTRAIIIVASQKTLPVMVAIVGQLGGALGQGGLLVIPCVAAHINQVGEALGDFLLVDTASSNEFRKTCARILVEINVSKGLPKMIKLASPNGFWIQLLDYEGIPFRCKKCQKIGHLAARCSFGKVRSKKSPSWWRGVLDDHYTVQKAPSVGDGLVDSSRDSLVVDYVVALMI